MTDNNNASADSRKSIVVSNTPPIAKFSAVPLIGLNPLSVVFVSKATDPDGHAIVAYEWDFDGDGIIDNNNPEWVHKYTEPDLYNARLRIKDEYGAWSLAQDLNIVVYELTAIRSVRATNTYVDGNSIFYIECALPKGAPNTVEISVSKSGVSSGQKVTINCNEYYIFGPITEAGVYTLTASIPGCSEIDCTKSTSFNVYEKTAEEVSAPEIGFPLVIALAFCVIWVVRRGNKAQ